MTLEEYIAKNVETEYTPRVKGVPFDVSLDEFTAWFFECRQDTLRGLVEEWKEKYGEQVQNGTMSFDKSQRDWLHKQLYLNDVWGTSI